MIVNILTLIAASTGYLLCCSAARLQPGKHWRLYNDSAQRMPHVLIEKDESIPKESVSQAQDLAFDANLPAGVSGLPNSALESSSETKAASASGSMIADAEDMAETADVENQDEMDEQAPSRSNSERMLSRMINNGTALEQITGPLKEFLVKNLASYAEKVAQGFILDGVLTSEDLTFNEISKNGLPNTWELLDNVPKNFKRKLAMLWRQVLKDAKKKVNDQQSNIKQSELRKLENIQAQVAAAREQVEQEANEGHGKASAKAKARLRNLLRGMDNFNTEPPLKAELKLTDVRTFIAQVEEDLRLTRDTLAQTRDLPVEDLIHQKNILRPILLQLTSDGPRNGVHDHVVRVRGDVEQSRFLVDPPDNTQLSYQTNFMSEKSGTYAEKSVSEFGTSFGQIVSGQAGVLGLVSGAISGASKLFMSTQRAEEAKQRRHLTTKNFIKLDIKSEPRGAIAIDLEDLELLPAARYRLQRIAKAGNKENQILKFFEQFGSHVCTKATLGGVMKTKASLQTRIETSSEFAQRAMSSVMSHWYGGAGGVVGLSMMGVVQGSAAVAGRYSSKESNANKRTESFHSLRESTTVSTEVTGGQPHLAAPSWRASLANNEKWAIIDRHIPECTPIWFFLDSRREQPHFNETDAARLSASMFKAWYKHKLGLGDSVGDFETEGDLTRWIGEQYEKKQEEVKFLEMCSGKDWCNNNGDCGTHTKGKCKCNRGSGPRCIERPWWKILFGAVMIAAAIGLIVMAFWTITVPVAATGWFGMGAGVKTTLWLTHMLGKAGLATYSTAAVNGAYGTATTAGIGGITMLASFAHDARVQNSLLQQPPLDRSNSSFAELEFTSIGVNEEDVVAALLTNQSARNQLEQEANSQIRAMRVLGDVMAMPEGRVALQQEVHKQRMKLLNSKSRRGMLKAAAAASHASEKELMGEAFAEGLSNDEDATRLLHQMDDFEKVLQNATAVDTISQRLLREADQLEKDIRKMMKSAAIKTPITRPLNQNEVKAVRKLTDHVLPMEAMMANELETWVVARKVEAKDLRHPHRIRVPQSHIKVISY